jgi:tetratricopeptide (TPR) repeat protein
VAILLAVLLLAVVTGSAGIGWQWYRAEGQRRRAEGERDEANKQRAAAEKEFRRAFAAVDQYLTRVGDSPELKAHNLEPLRRDLLRTARDFYTQLIEDHPDNPDLRAELGRAHGRLGLITAQLDTWPQALPHYREQLAIFQRLHEEQPDRAEYQRELAASYCGVGNCYNVKQQTAEAEASYLRSRDLWEGLTRTHPDEPEYQEGLAGTQCDLGLLYRDARRFREAEQALQDGRAVGGPLTVSHPAVPKYRARLALTLVNLGLVYLDTSQPDKAKEVLREAIALLERLAHKYIVEAWQAVKQGDHAGATAKGSAVAARAPKDGPRLYRAATAFALSAAAVRGNTALPAAGRDALVERYAARAVALLRQARTNWPGPPEQPLLSHLRTDKDFAALRGRDDFKRLLKELEGAGNIGSR